MNQLNLALRFLLEVVALVSVGMWGWKAHEGWLQYTLALLIPIALATLWGIFNVPNDPSRNGNAPVVVPGYVRLFIELAIFGGAASALYGLGYETSAVIFGGIIVFHYAASYERIAWLLKQ